VIERLKLANNVLYFVKWKGHDRNHNTYEHYNALKLVKNALDVSWMVKAYCEAHPQNIYTKHYNKDSECKACERKMNTQSVWRHQVYSRCKAIPEPVELRKPDEPYCDTCNLQMNTFGILQEHIKVCGKMENVKNTPKGPICNLCLCRQRSYKLLKFHQ